MEQALLLYRETFPPSPPVLEEFGRRFGRFTARPIGAPGDLSGFSFVVVLGSALWTEEDRAVLSTSLGINPLSLFVFPYEEMVSLPPAVFRMLWQGFLARLVPPSSVVRAQVLFPTKSVLFYPSVEPELLDIFESGGIPVVSLPSSFSLTRQGVDFAVTPGGKRIGAFVLSPSWKETAPVAFDDETLSTRRVLSLSDFWQSLPSLSLWRKNVVVLVSPQGFSSEEWEMVFALSSLCQEGASVVVLAEEVFVAEDGFEEQYRRAREKGVLFERVSLGEVVFRPTPDMRRIRVTARATKDSFPLSFCADWCVYLPERSMVLPSLEGVLASYRVLFRPRISENPNSLPFSTTFPGVFFVPFEKKKFPALFAVVREYLERPQAVEFQRLVIDEEKCALCLTCLRSCPWEALSIGGTLKRRRVEVEEERCRHCGICTGLCPARAITLLGYETNKLRSVFVWSESE
ncbi:MAG: 4Fe-4S binding protein [Candidatus Caldatribacteriaceae bacterium]